MRALDKKLLRDLRRIWAQALAIALVMAAGVSTLILAVGAYRSLEETRAAYYERHRFADVFSRVKRAPKHVEEQIRALPGVSTVEARIMSYALLDIEGFVLPATGLAVSLPDRAEQSLNTLYLRRGRLPEPAAVNEVVVNEAFATAHHFTIGSKFHAILNGKKRPLTIVGIALSPEYIYAIGPGDLMPDDRRFAVMWMSEETLSVAFDLKGAFNSVTLKLSGLVPEAEVIRQLDALTERYGGTGAIGRTDQFSHAFLDAELTQLYALARVIPPIFLFVSAFLINMTLTRLIALEREQIGLLKAIGYGRLEIAAHYLKLILVVSAVGVLIGFVLGTRFGLALTQLYGEFFHFPFLIFERAVDIYLLAAGVSAGAAVVGALKAVWSASALAPAVAMQPPAPPIYRRHRYEQLARLGAISQLTMMSLRHIFRWPMRAALTTLGAALAGALLVVSLFSLDSVEHMIDVNFFLAQRQDATINLVEPQDIRVLNAARQLPGVLRVEPYREALVLLRNGQYSRKLAVVGKPAEPALSRVVNRSLEPVSLPSMGVMLDEHVAGLLRVSRGDVIELQVLGGWRGGARAPDPPLKSADDTAPPSATDRNVIRVPVTGIMQSYFGLTAYMNIDALNALLDEGAMVSGLHLSYDRAHEEEFFTAVKGTPAISSIALQRVSLVKFRETLAKNIDTMVSIYVSLAIIVAMGVVYNSARIQLSEQARELASLRVMGFTRGEISRVLLVELAILVVAAQPLSWLLGYGFGWITIQGFSSDLYRAPFVINISTYAMASLVVLGAAAVAALIVRQRIDRLNLIAVLKTRD